MKQMFKWIVTSIQVIYFCQFTRCILFTFSGQKLSDKKKLIEKIKEKENRLKKKQQEQKQQELQENVNFPPSPLPGF